MTAARDRYKEYSNQMTRPSADLEQRVARIHRLIEVEGSAITWNDRIPDPDNPSQPRQIDVTIRRDGKLTMVECRLHQGPQDVTWIEEIMGRRISLQADAAIAASASGFTAGAKAKATRHGVILRDLAELSEEEVRGWGATRKVCLVFCQFSDASLTITMPPGFVPCSTPTIADASGGAVNWRPLFELVATSLEEERWDGHNCDFELDVGLSCTVDGCSPVSGRVKGTSRYVRQEVSLASVVVYTEPGSNTGAETARVARYQSGSEIIEASDEVSVMADLSQVQVPDNSVFRSFNIDFGRYVVFKGLYPVGLPAAMNASVPLRISLRSSA
jgi:hypothetical protein